ncbi:hypothetical protein [Tenacibaculum geojense]|uniref:Lipoprotein n=1 Tax=Tenacibaculum geojense TaxID=915352 RepID=A0ABW3JM78_9FLAO
MKKILLFLIFTLGTLSCNSQLKSKEEEKKRLEIDKEFNQNSVNCFEGVQTVSDFNDKKEFWNICELENGNRIITIESHEKEIFFQEIYFERNGELIYAKETENFMPKNHFAQMSWNCEFYIEKGKLISLISLGHGKTEDDNWNPEMIIKMYKTRLTELKRIKN